MIIKNVEKPPTWVRMSSLGGGGTDPIKTAELMLENAMRPKLEEPAIVHPFNTSMVKIRNNGMIDMFVGTDQGIRLDPYSKTLNEIIDGLKWHIGYFKGWIDQDAEWYANNKILFESKSSSFTVNAKTDISLISGKDIVIKCEGKLRLSATDGVAIDTQGDFTMGGKAVNLNSDGDLMMNGSTVQLGSGSAKSKASRATREDEGSCNCTGGEIISGSSKVFIDGMPAARVGDRVSIT